MKNTKFKRATLRKSVLRLFTLISILILPIGLITTQAFAASLSTLQISNSVSTVSTATVLTVTWTNVSTYTTGDTFTIAVPAVTGTTSDSTHFAQNSLANTDVSVTAPAAYSSATKTVTLSGGYVNIQVTVPAATTTTGGNSFSVTIGATNKLKNPTVAGNFTVNFSSVLAGGNSDFGSGIVSVGNANQVQITATVNSAISFNIDKYDDTAQSSFPATCGNTNGGGSGANNGLGTLSTASTSYCQYRLKVATNAASGFTVSYVVNGAITNGSYTLANPSGTTTESTAGSIAAGTEAYGMNVQPGSVTGSGATVSSNKTCSTNCTSTGNAYRFDNTSTPYSIYTANKLNNPSSTDTTNTALVTHLATVSAGTQAGNYTQTVTYSVVASF